MTSKPPRLGLLNYLHAALVPLVPLGLGFALLLAFKYGIGEDLHDLARIIGVIVIWFLFSVSANLFLEVPERAKARREGRRRAKLLAERHGGDAKRGPAYTGKPIRPSDR